jgi:hypothetical protein
MPNFDERREILLFVHQSQHEESLEHRQSILSAFSLSMAGLLAIMAGAITTNSLSVPAKVGIGVGVFIAFASVTLFIRQQRRKSESAREIQRNIERELSLYEENVYLDEQAVLPQKFETPQRDFLGLTHVDLTLIAPLFLLSVCIIVVVSLIPSLPPCSSVCTSPLPIPSP